MDPEIRIPSLNKSTRCEPDKSILEAFLRTGVWLPHSCTQGTCGTCKLRVLEGTVDHRATSQHTLTDAERWDGIALGCQATPCADLIVEPVNHIAEEDIERHPLRDHSGTVSVLADIARDVRRLVVDLDEPMLFHAGQYAEISVPGTGVARQYSMANAPGASGARQLEFHIKRTPGGVATDRWMFKDLRQGDRVQLRGPLGNFGMRDPSEHASLLIAGGTGLAPLKAIVQYALAEGVGGDLHVYHGGRSRADLYDLDYFRTLEDEHERVHYRPCLSEETWDGAMGMVTDVVLEDFTSCKVMTGYVCGPPAMVSAANRALKRRRMAPRRIFSEEFLDTSGSQEPE